MYDIARFGIFISNATLDGEVQNLKELERLFEDRLRRRVITEGIQNREVRAYGPNSVQPVGIQVKIKGLAHVVVYYSPYEQD